MSMKDFSILCKLGMIALLLTVVGEGAFSMVYKVKRNSDNKVYALKKVLLLLR